MNLTYQLELFFIGQDLWQGEEPERPYEDAQVRVFLLVQFADQIQRAAAADPQSAGLVALLFAFVFGLVFAPVAVPAIAIHFLNILLSFPHFVVVVGTLKERRTPRHPAAVPRGWIWTFSCWNKRQIHKFAHFSAHPITRLNFFEK